jgi:2,3-bisphosphoglycerate-independent phosphoglycerate mutase
VNKKFLILLIDGAGDYPLPELGGRTPLEVAKTPNLDRLSGSAKLGMVKTIPDGFPPGSDVANLSVLGYDPRLYYTGRSSFEALNMGVELASLDVALRCNLVTLSGDGDYDDYIMKDYSAGEIDTQDAKGIIEECQRVLGSDEFRFYHGVSYRHVVVWSGGDKNIELTPPHDISDKRIGDYLPKGRGSQALRNLMRRSLELLPTHPINLGREKRHQAPANSIWFWGQGTKPALRQFKERFGLSGSAVSAVDLIKGIGLAAGLKPVDVSGATGRVDTNFGGKADAVLERFGAGDDFVFLHIEAADEAGHQGSVETKIRAIELVDELVLQVIIEKMQSFGDYSLMILPDHYTPICKRTHVSDPVPFMIYESRNRIEGADGFTEREAAKTGLYFEQGHELIEYFIK